MSFGNGKFLWLDTLTLEPINLEVHIDLAIGIIAGAIYVLVVWVAAFLAIVYVGCKNTSDLSHSGLQKEWRRLYKMYNYFEIMFRTHLIVLVCVGIMDVFETDSDSWTPLKRYLLLAGASFILLLLYACTRFIRKRIHRIKEQLSYDNIFKSQKFQHLRKNTFNKAVFRTFYQKFGISNNELINPLLEDESARELKLEDMTEEQMRQLTGRKKKTGLDAAVMRAEQILARRSSITPPSTTRMTEMTIVFAHDHDHDVFDSDIHYAKNDDNDGAEPEKHLQMSPIHYHRDSATNYETWTLERHNKSFKSTNGTTKSKHTDLHERREISKKKKDTKSKSSKQKNNKQDATYVQLKDKPHGA